MKGSGRPPSVFCPHFPPHCAAGSGRSVRHAARATATFTRHRCKPWSTRRRFGRCSFFLPPDTAHELAFAALGPVEYIGWVRACFRALAGTGHATNDRIATRVMGLDFPSVVGLAGGFDKNARRPRALAALGFGHLELGTVTARPQAANPRPNLFRLRADRALVNRLGFPNEGAAHLAARLRHVRREGRAPLGVRRSACRSASRVSSPSTTSPRSSRITLPQFGAVHGVADFVVVNVSSPNTAGLRTMQARDHALGKLLSALARPGSEGRAASREDRAGPHGRAARRRASRWSTRSGLDGVVATNTTIARAGLATNAAEVEAIGAGGLSRPTAPAALHVDVVCRVRARLDRRVAVIGVGGIEEAEHALALVRAGADLVQMYTGFVYGGPLSAARIGREPRSRSSSIGEHGQHPAGARLFSSRALASPRGLEQKTRRHEGFEGLAVPGSESRWIRVEGHAPRDETRVTTRIIPGSSCLPVHSSLE